jgi:hypothetical protein
VQLSAQVRLTNSVTNAGESLGEVSEHFFVANDPINSVRSVSYQSTWRGKRTIGTSFTDTQARATYWGDAELACRRPRCSR